MSRNLVFLKRRESTSKLNMIDVNNKKQTIRKAKSSVTLTLIPEAYQKLKENNLHKGDAITLATACGIANCKRTSELFPLCHQVPISSVDISFEFCDATCCLKVISTVISQPASTGVEMESLVTGSMAALCIYDMCKSLSQNIVISEIKLIEKSGGKTYYNNS